MKKTLLYVGIMLSVLLLSTSCSPDDSISQATEQSVQQFEAAGIENMDNDALFVAEATSASMLQMRLGALASVEAVSPEVKQMAQQLAQDHERIQNDLRETAAQSNFVVPEELGSNHQSIYDDVESTSGITFDLTYIKRAVEEHKQLVRRYGDMAENGATMEVKQFASKQLPLLKQHLQEAEALEDQVKGV
ncbi:DUF4142 domain-containing protein [Pontibacter harenae]|uniref:DUF4142 domain-containing protein n=1 Tax=Pontibacter harenae TaxID=2894083 RepID=UPI001E287894|nr:DUF4142 domain-containing protein [Pontibacter harenae]MCC9165218.1 DUF4142 domain-containing protein [Pontibacter harenae]